MASLLNIRQGLQQYSVRIEYLKPLAKYNTEKPYLLGLDIPLADESDRSNLEFESINLKAADARIVRDRLSVECHGFELLTLPPEVMARHFDHNDKRLEMEGVHAILANKFKTDKVIVYDHAYRMEEQKDEEAKYTFSNRPTQSIIVRNPHADQSTASGRKRVETFLSSHERKQYSKDSCRIRIVNFWKPIRRKIKRAPLLLCDPLSITTDNIIPCDVITSTYAGESVFLTYSTQHQWFWFKDQDVDEALLFISYDSSKTEDSAGCFHTSCDIVDDIFVPSIQECPRESVEVRALVITPLGR